jgi:hypothetical protein
MLVMELLPILRFRRLHNILENEASRDTSVVVDLHGCWQQQQQQVGRYLFDGRSAGSAPSSPIKPPSSALLAPSSVMPVERLLAPAAATGGPAPSSIQTVLVITAKQHHLDYCQQEPALLNKRRVMSRWEDSSLASLMT